jgi:hypothetical protein
MWAPRTCLTKITQDRLANGNRHWIALCSSHLRPRDMDCLSCPIEIVQRQSRDFTAPQTIVGSATIELRERGLLRGRRWTQCLREAGRSVQWLGPAEHPQVYIYAAVRYYARNRIDTIADSRRSGKSYAIYKPVRVTTYGSIPGLHGPSENAST